MIPLIEPDCTGRKHLREVQLHGLVKKFKEKGILNQAAPASEGRGIVIPGGGKYLSWAWCSAKRMRDLGCQLPIQVWHIGKTEMPDYARPYFYEIGVELVDAMEVRKRHPMRILDGWTLKAFSVMNCPFRQVMFTDADSFVEVQPEEIFNHKDVRRVGSIFFSDVKNCHPVSWAYVHFGLRRGKKEMETGQFVIDKTQCWVALRWAFWCGEHREVWDKLLLGDKGWFEMGLRTTDSQFLWSDEAEWCGWGIKQSYRGMHWWSHVMGAKRNEARLPEHIEDIFDQWHELTQNISPV